jgi:hypothetical protein
MLLFAILPSSVSLLLWSRTFTLSICTTGSVKIAILLPKFICTTFCACILNVLTFCICPLVCFIARKFNSCVAPSAPVANAFVSCCCCYCCAFAVEPIPIIRILEKNTTRLKVSIFVFISLIEGMHV